MDFFELWDVSLSTNLLTLMGLIGILELLTAFYHYEVGTVVTVFRNQLS